MDCSYIIIFIVVIITIITIIATIVITIIVTIIVTIINIYSGGIHVIKLTITETPLGVRSPFEANNATHSFSPTV